MQHIEGFKTIEVEKSLVNKNNRNMFEKKKIIAKKKQEKKTNKEIEEKEEKTTDNKEKNIQAQVKYRMFIFFSKI